MIELIAMIKRKRARHDSRPQMTLKNLGRRCFMKTIEQIQEKLYLMQEENRRIETCHRKILILQSEIDTLLIDVKYDFQIEKFLAAR